MIEVKYIPPPKVQPKIQVTMDFVVAETLSRLLDACYLSSKGMNELRLALRKEVASWVKIPTPILPPLK